MARPDPVSAPAAASAPAPVGECVRAFEENFDFLYRALRRHGVSASDADDLAQDVFIAMWRSWAQFDGTRPLRPWVGGIVFRVARSHLRRRRREVPAGEVDIEDDSLPGEEGLAARRARALVLRAVSALPEKHRTPLVLHELEGMSMHEVAALMEVPLATAYTRIRRARLAFAKVVEQFLATEARQRRFTVLTPEALLVLERVPVPAPERARRTARSRIAALPFLAGGDAPGGQWSPRWAPPSPGSLAPFAALAAAGAVVLGAAALLLAWRPPAADGAHRAVSHSRGQRATDQGKRNPLASRRRVSTWLPAIPAPAPGTAAPEVRAIDRGLTGYWRFDEDQGGLLVRDRSGHNRDCLLHGIEPARAWIPDGAHGGAIELAARGWLECPQRTHSTGSPIVLTVASWVRLRSFQYTNTAVASRQIAAGYKDQFFLGFTGPVLRLTSHVWQSELKHPLSRALGRWFHVAFTRDELGTSRLYLDGVEVDRATSPEHHQGEVTSALTAGAGQFSRYPQLVRQRLDGALDELRIYDRALAPDEIALLARDPDPGFAVATAQR